MMSAQVCFSPFHGESKSSLSCINNQMFGDSSSRPKDDESILLYIAPALDSEFPIRVLESHSIESLTLRIINTRANGVVMNRDHKNVDVLQLVTRVEDLQVINVKTYSGKEFTLSMEKYRRVKNDDAENKNGGDEDKEVLYDDLELEDQQILYELCSHENSNVHIIVRKSAEVRSIPVEKILELSITGPNVKKRKRNDDCRVTKGCKKEAEIVKSDSVQLLEPLVLNHKVQLSEAVEHMIMQTLNGLENGKSPVRTSEGTGGSYFMQDSSGENVAVFKPTDEEPNAINNPHGLQACLTGEGLKKGTKVGEGAFREVAAYVLDQKGFARVPPTFMVKCLHSGFNHTDGFKDVAAKFGSLQKFVKNTGSCEDMGPADFPVSEVHKISVLDIRMANADRHAGNILISKDEEDGRNSTVLIPIDHGYCLPESVSDVIYSCITSNV